MKEISYLLLDWYSKAKRELPWRVNKKPYSVWISEIMLQQTRIEAVIPYYERFMQYIPDIQSLANIPEDKLLKLWEGLGYYNRARNLKKAAIMIMNDYHGIFPNTYAEIISLPGIGEYTASAIASFCFNEATPTVDGNVLRVLSRVNEDHRNVDLARTKKEIRQELAQIMPLEAGDFNEALMEIGEVICLPKGEPKCYICPLKEICKAHLHDTYSLFPVKEEKVQKKEIFYTVFLFFYQGKYAIRKRVNQQILHNLWEFPNISGKLAIDEVKRYLKSQKIGYLSIREGIDGKHVFTHQIWYMNSYFVEVSHEITDFVWVTVDEMMKKYAIPTAFRPFLRELNGDFRHTIL